MVQNQKHSIPFIFVVTIYQLYIYHLSIKCAFILYFAVRGLLVLKLRPQSNRYKVFGTKNKPKLCSTIWRSLKYISILIYIQQLSIICALVFTRELNFFLVLLLSSPASLTLSFRLFTLLMLGARFGVSFCVSL